MGEEVDYCNLKEMFVYYERIDREEGEGVDRCKLGEGKKYLNFKCSVFRKVKS